MQELEDQIETKNKELWLYRNGEMQMTFHEMCDENANHRTPRFHKLTFGQFLCLLNNNHNRRLNKADLF